MYFSHDFLKKVFITTLNKNQVQNIPVIIKQQIQDQNMCPFYHRTA